MITVPLGMSACFRFGRGLLCSELDYLWRPSPHLEDTDCHSHPAEGLLQHSSQLICPYCLWTLHPASQSKWTYLGQLSIVNPRRLPGQCLDHRTSLLHDDPFDGFPCVCAFHLSIVLILVLREHGHGFERGLVANPARASVHRPTPSSAYHP